MMELIGILLFIGSVVGGGFLTLIFLHLLAPLIVRSIGEDKFVDMGGLEPCSTVIFSGIVGGILYTIAAQKWGFALALLLFPTLSLLCVVYFVLWLRFATIGKNKQEFKIANGQLIRFKDGVILNPTYVREDSDYSQTDAFHGYSTYQLVLCDENGELAKNGYVNEEKKNAALREILEAAREIPCRALDLIFIRREAETVWLQVRISQQSVPVLCGSLSRLSERSRNWWRQWLRPQFPEDGYSQVTNEELDQHLEALIAAYFSYLPTREQSMHQLSKSPKNEWSRLRMLLKREGPPIELMTSQKFEEEVNCIAPTGATLCYDSSLAMKIERN